MSRALGPPISFALLSLSFFFLRFHCILGRGQMLFGGKHCQEFAVVFIKEQKENSIHVHGSEMSFRLLLLFCSPHCRWEWRGAEARKGEAHTVLVATALRAFPFMFRLRRFISPTYWTTDTSCFSPGWEENTFLCLNQSLHTITIKINQIHMPMTQRHMTYTSKHSGFDGWNFNQV